MNVPLIIGLILFILGALLIIKMIKKIITVVFAFLGLAVIIIAAMSVLAAVDRSQVQERFPDEANLFILDEDGILLTAYATAPFTNINGSELDALEDMVRNGEYPPGYFKVVVIPLATIDAFTFDTVTTDGTTYSRDEFFKLLRSETASQRKTEALRALIDDMILEGGSVEPMFQYAKEGRITVHKRTIAFRRYWLR